MFPRLQFWLLILRGSPVHRQTHRFRRPRHTRGRKAVTKRDTDEIFKHEQPHEHCLLQKAHGRAKPSSRFFFPPSRQTDGARFNSGLDKRFYCRRTVCGADRQSVRQHILVHIRSPLLTLPNKYVGRRAGRIRRSSWSRGGNGGSEKTTQRLRK